MLSGRLLLFPKTSCTGSISRLLYTEPGRFWRAAAFLALIPIYLYNGKRGRQLKYGFYIFYPLHLLLLCPLISVFS
ncbi:hypothetical protein DXA96_06645 [Lachnospiraceae bacterium OF09-33XD]|nr:hypothetical protein DXA96_06645 [Lachnospiraceae bacterium OF09-33XD]